MALHTRLPLISPSHTDKLFLRKTHRRHISMKRLSHFFTRPYFSIIGILVIAACAAQAQVERTFSVPLTDLKTWSENVVVSFKAKVTGHSAVHPVASDCEMHMGANL